jgi:hypothetical protein
MRNFDYLGRDIGGQADIFGLQQPVPGEQAATFGLELSGPGGETAIFESPSPVYGEHATAFGTPSEPKLNKDFSLFIFKRNHTSITILISHLFICYLDCNQTK